MEQAILQLNNSNMASMDAFIEAVCEERHLDTYFATIAVAVSNAVRYALAMGCGTLSLSCNHYDKGVCFTLSCAEGVFGSFLSEGTMLTDAPTSEMTFLTNTLSDDLRVGADGSTLEIYFAVQGIDPRECASRIAVMEKFYQPALIEA